MGNGLENLMYQTGQFFLIPSLVLIGVCFLYAFWLLGGFCIEYFKRKNGTSRPLIGLYEKNKNIGEDELDLYAHKLLEIPRVVSRVTPMLGLVATMIPMGPALRSLSDGNLAKVSDNLTIAFSAVILALIAASITYYVSNIKKRWLAEEMLEILKIRGDAK